jgi:hypothetical protein
MERTFIDNSKNDDLKKSLFTTRIRQKKTKVKSTMIVNNTLKRVLPVRSLSEQLMEVVIREFEKIK